MHDMMPETNLYIYRENESAPSIVYLMNNWVQCSIHTYRNTPKTKESKRTCTRPSAKTRFT